MTRNKQTGLLHYQRHRWGQRFQAPADEIQNASRNERHEARLPLQQKQSSVSSAKLTIECRKQIVIYKHGGYVLVNNGQNSTGREKRTVNIL